MSTRSRIEIDGINLYSHNDGYIEGMADKLYDAIDMQDKDTYKTTPFINAFIAANKNNCEIDLNEEIGGLGWAYIIDTKKLSIKVYKADWQTGDETYQDTYSIDDFINKFLEDKRVYRVRDYLYTNIQILKYYEYYKTRAAGFDEDNPNKQDCLDFARELIKAIDFLTVPISKIDEYDSFFSSKIEELTELNRDEREELSVREWREMMEAIKEKLCI